MDELLLAIVVLFFKLIAWIVKSLYKLVLRLLRALGRAQSGEGGQVARAAPAPTKIGQKTPPVRGVPASSAQVNTRAGSPSLVTALDDLARRAAALGERAAELPSGEVLTQSIDEWIVPAIFDLRSRVQGARVQAGDALRTLAHLRGLVSLVEEMVDQRDDKELAFLVGDSDALADACYAPLVGYAEGAGLDLGARTTLTLLGDRDLATWIGLHLGFAPIVLPPEWATEIAWWPALLHEVGHAFYGTLRGFDSELREALRLPRVAGTLVEEPVTESELWRPFASWLDELAADALGVMAMGPAYVRTMMWAFGTQGHEEALRAIADGSGARYEEHPPAHLRVVLGCRLLTAMGYPNDGRQLEAEWRRSRKMPTTLTLLARSGRWLLVDENALIERGVIVVRSLYEERWKSLGERPLRSIPGFDFGPREHALARREAARLAAGEMADSGNARCLIAGAVLARFERPSQGKVIARAARASIAALGVSHQRVRLRGEQEAARHLDLAGGLDLTTAAEAILLDAIFSPPPSLRASRR